MKLYAAVDDAVLEELFDHLEWEEVEDISLDTLLEGKTIVGVELVDYPLTDGILIYWREMDGRLWVLEASAASAYYISPNDVDDDENPMVFQKAAFPAGI